MWREGESERADVSREGESSIRAGLCHEGEGERAELYFEGERQSRKARVCVDHACAILKLQ